VWKPGNRVSQSETSLVGAFDHFVECANSESAILEWNYWNEEINNGKRT
jgi:hypothetical protein